MSETMSKGPALWPWRAVDVEFDAAVVALAAKSFPNGFDVSDAAPQTYEDLMHHLDSGKRMLVWSGASQFTIYGSPAINYAFRAWHDGHHWRSRYPFTLAGEAATVTAQVEDLRQMFGNHPRARLWQSILYAEVLGQVLYAELNGGAFPPHQRQFVQRFIEALLDEQPALPNEYTLSTPRS